jgi:hypothetical protein
MHRKLALAAAVARPARGWSVRRPGARRRSTAPSLRQVLDLVKTGSSTRSTPPCSTRRRRPGSSPQLRIRTRSSSRRRSSTQFNQNTAGRLRRHRHADRGAARQGRHRLQGLSQHAGRGAAGVREGDVIVAIDTDRARRAGPRRRSPTAARRRRALQGEGRASRAPASRRTDRGRSSRAAVIRIPAVPFALMLRQEGRLHPAAAVQRDLHARSSAAVRKLVTAVDGAKGARARPARNGGGFLDQSLDLTNLFLPQGRRARHGARPQRRTRAYVGAARSHRARVPIVDPHRPATRPRRPRSSPARCRTTIARSSSAPRRSARGSCSPCLPPRWRLRDQDHHRQVVHARAAATIQKERVLDADGQFVEVHPDSLERRLARKRVRLTSRTLVAWSTVAAPSPRT